MKSTVLRDQSSRAMKLVLRDLVTDIEDINAGLTTSPVAEERSVLLSLALLLDMELRFRDRRRRPLAFTKPELFDKVAPTKGPAR